MDINIGNYIDQLYRKLTHNNYIRPEDLPELDLYMDQVTTFMDTKLSQSKRYPDDKILTKTMINNYAKNHVLPAPVKKKYSKEHMLLLIFIYYLKNILSINDIQTLLAPLSEAYATGESKEKASVTLEDIYRQIVQLERSQADALEHSIEETLARAKTCFTDAPDEERDYLQLFAFIGTLGYEVYIKQQMIERLIDQIAADRSEAEKDAKSTEKPEKK